MQEKNNLEIIEDFEDRENLFEEPENLDNEIIEKNRKWINENTHNTLDAISKELANLNVNDEMSNNYLNIVNEFEKLSECIEKIGDAKLEEDKKNEVLNHYQNVANEMEKFSKFENEKTYNEFFAHFNKLKKCVSDDIRALIKMKRPQTISEISQNGRKRTITITGQEINNIGANLSQRQIINDGDEKKIFTKNTIYDFKKNMKDNYNKMCNEYPEYVEFFDMFNKPLIYRHFSTYLPVKFEQDGIHVLPEDRIDEVFKTLKTNFDTQINSSDIPQNVKDEYIKVKRHLQNIEDKVKSSIREDNILEVAMQEYFYGMFNVNNQRNFNKHIDSKNDPIDERNSGMSVVAELLGIGNVICHSEPVILKDGNQEIEGTVMDFSKGTDINNTSIDDPITNYDKNEIEITPEANKQIADVQVLDYICGNLDRHAGNLFLKYDTSDVDHPKLVGVEGIDNDCSFFARKGLNHLQNCNMMVGLSTLRLIDKKTAERIKLVTPAMLKIALQGLKINKEAIDNTITRFEELKAVIEKGNEVKEEKDLNFEKSTNEIDKIKINIVDGKEAWEHIDVYKINYKFNDEQNKNLFNQTYAANSGRRHLQYIKPQQKDLYEAQKELFKERLKSRKNIKENTKKLDDNSKFLRSSSEYRAVQKALKEVKNAESKIKITSNEKVYKNYKAKLETLKTKANEYLDKKKKQESAGVKFSDYTQNRINAVTEIQNIINQRCIDYTLKYNSLQLKANILTTRVNKIKDFDKQKAKRFEGRSQREQEKAMAEVKALKEKQLHNKLEAKEKAAENTEKEYKVALIQDPKKEKNKEI